MNAMRKTTQETRRNGDSGGVRDRGTECEISMMWPKSVQIPDSMGRESSLKATQLSQFCVHPDPIMRRPWFGLWFCWP